MIRDNKNVVCKNTKRPNSEPSVATQGLGNLKSLTVGVYDIRSCPGH